MSLKGKTAIVTGASQGIGEAVARALAEEGVNVVLAARSGSKLASLAADLLEKGCRALDVPTDVSQESSVRNLMRRTLEHFPTVHILVNAAGVLTERAPLHEVETQDWDSSLAVNLRGPFLMVKEILPLMLRQKDGVILNVSSGAGKRAAPEWGPYAVSKFGVEGFTLALAEETRDSGVSVYAVNPGGTRTAMRAQAYPEEDPKTLPTPREVASFFVYLASTRPKTETPSLDYREWAHARGTVA